MVSEKTPTRRGFATFATRLLLTLLPGVGLGLYAMFPAAVFLVYLAPVPWILLYTDPRRPKVSAAWFLLGIWVAWMLMYRRMWAYGWFVPPMMALFFVLPWWPFAPVLRAIHRRTDLPRTLTVPIVTVAVEWLRVRFATSHFDLFLLGYAQAPLAVLTQIADVTGVWGISFVVATVHGLTADVGFAAREDGLSAKLLKRRPLVVSAIATAALFALTIGYGVFRLSTARHEPGPRLAIVQPNVRHTIRNLTGVHLTQIELTERLVPAESADLIVWPENALFADLESESVWREDIGWLAARKGAPVLLGDQGYSREIPGRMLNRAVLVGTDARILGTYSKRVLYPWSEFIPLDSILGTISPAVQRAHRSLIRKAWGYLAVGSAGREAALLNLPWHGGTIPFGALICVENTYPVVPAEAARLGARFFVNITSEGEIAGTIQEQLLRICSIRAVENRIAYVRCGNTGISGFIDPEGRIFHLLRGRRGGTVEVEGALIDRVPLSGSGPTIYSRSHDAFAFLCLAATVALLAYAFLRGRGRVGNAAATAVALALLVSLAGCGKPVVPGGDPARAGEALARAKQLFDAQKPAAAIAEFAAACSAEEPCRQGFPVMIAAFRQLGSEAATAAFFDGVAAKHPALAAEAHSARAYLYEMSGDLEGALREYDASVRARETAAALVYYGNLLLRIGKVDEAISTLARGARIAPREPSVVYSLARALATKGETAEARRRLEAALEAGGTHASSWVLLGRLRLETGDRPGAEEAFRRALSLDPSSIDARYQQARLAMRDERFDELSRLRREIMALEANLGRGPRQD